MTIQDLLSLVVTQNASDLHIQMGAKPTLRVDGRLVPIEGTNPLTKDEAKTLVASLLNEQQQDFFVKNRELDLSYQFGDMARFRINVYFQMGAPAAALRLIPTKIRSLEELGLPLTLQQMTKLKQGLVLVTGPTGSGKSTTLAAMLNEINTTRSENIITVEDPIEFIYEPMHSLISQREVHYDTLSWSMALKSILREDPNVVLIGEMRDYETIASALTIAETGHLVFATLHTNSAAQTLDRIIDVFPEHQQAQVRMQLSNTLSAVIAQRLVPAVQGGRVPVNEILLANSAVSNMIREGKTHQIDNVILTSSEIGMMTMESSLAKWVQSEKVAFEVAQKYAQRPGDLQRLVYGDR